MSDLIEPIKPTNLVVQSLKPNIHIILLSNSKRNWLALVGLPLYFGAAATLLFRINYSAYVSHVLLSSLILICVAAYLQRLSKTIIEADSRFLHVYTRFRLNRQILPIPVSQIHSFEIIANVSPTGQQLGDRIFARMQDTLLRIVAFRIDFFESKYIKFILEKVLINQGALVYPVLNHYEKKISYGCQIRKNLNKLRLEKLMPEFIGPAMLSSLIAVAFLSLFFNTGVSIKDRFSFFLIPSCLPAFSCY